MTASRQYPYISYDYSMFFRFKRSIQNGVLYEYLQIAESFRQDGKPRSGTIIIRGFLGPDWN